MPIPAPVTLPQSVDTPPIAPVAGTSVPARDLAAEDAVRAAETTWFLESECTDVLTHVKGLLAKCHMSLLEANAMGPRAPPTRCGSVDTGLMVGAVVGGTSIHAMRVHVELPKWNGGAAYSGMLGGGQRVVLALPALLGVSNRVAQALAALGQGWSTLPAARATAKRLYAVLSDAVHLVSLSPAPTQPSSLAAQLTDMLDPPPPPDLRLDVSVAGEEPGEPCRLVFSAYALGKDGAVLEACHATADADEIAERVRLLDEAKRATRGLLAKIDALAG